MPPFTFTEFLSSDQNDRIEMNKRICNILFFSFATSDLLIQVQ